MKFNILDINFIIFLYWGSYYWVGEDISMKYKYIETIYHNVKSVDKSSLHSLYDCLKDYDCIIVYGSGRSYAAIKIAVSQYSKMKGSPTIITPEDPGFPGNNIYEALDNLRERFSKIFLLVNSGSGETLEPLIVAKDFVNYIDNNNANNLILGVITSKPESSLGRLAGEYGVLVHLKGRGEHKLDDFLTSGIMGDTFELGSLLLLTGLIKSIYLGSINYFDDIIDTYYQKIYELLDRYVDSKTFGIMIDMMARRSNVFIGGRGSAHEVATMLVIRLNHIKYAIGDHVYRARGSNTPRPRPGDLGILISCSGETPAIISWAKSLQASGAYVVAIVGNPNSLLARIVDNKVIIDSRPIEKFVPRDFYLYASFLLSPLPIRLIERFKEEGLVLPESILRYYHSIVE